jgi:hypothetical protein
MVYLGYSRNVGRRSASSDIPACGRDFSQQTDYIVDLSISPECRSESLWFPLHFRRKEAQYRCVRMAPIMLPDQSMFAHRRMAPDPLDLSHRSLQ